MELYTADEMRAVDRHAIETVGIAAAALMETAGRAVAAAASRLLEGRSGRKVVVLAGKGNNGGDGLVAARVLKSAGTDVHVLLTAEPSEGGVAAENLRAARALRIPVTTAEDPSSRSVLEGGGPWDLCIDALLGVGARGAPEGVTARWIEAANNLACPILAVDVPSGLDASTGQTPGACIRADYTVTFGAGKVGLYSDPGIRYAGKVEVADIGFPPDSLHSIKPRVRLLTRELVADWLPPRPKWANKGDAGPAIIVAGSEGMMGAAGLCSRAAMRAGCGLTKLMVPGQIITAANSLTLEVICVPAPSAPGGHLGLKALDTILGAAEHARAVGIGPGISTDDETAALIEALLPALSAPMVVDADALNILSRKMDVLHKLKAPCVITPHPGEMGRLCGCSTAEVQANRIERARNLAAAYGIVVVLKGSATVVADPGGDILLNSTGNAGMATAGAGDVLTGAITGLLAQKLNPFEAAGAGVFLHGLAGDLWAAEHGSVGLMAGDLAEKLPEARASVCSENPQMSCRHGAGELLRDRA